MLKGIGYLLFGVGLCFMSPKFIKQYKKDKNIENILEVIGVILLAASSILLGVLEFLQNYKFKFVEWNIKHQRRQKSNIYRLFSCLFSIYIAINKQEKLAEKLTSISNASH